MQPGPDAAASPMLVRVELCGEDEDSIGIWDVFYFLERRPLLLGQNPLEINNRLIELLFRR